MTNHTPLQLKSAAPHPPRHLPWRLHAPGQVPIGVLSPCYGSSRVIFGLPTPNYRHVKLTKIPLSWADTRSTFFTFTPVVADWNTPLLHSWNTIPVNKEFLMSFESEIPRYLGEPREWMVRYGLDQLASKRCKGILALSEFARRNALRTFAEFGYGSLEEKLSVFRGGVWDPFASKSLAEGDLELPSGEASGPLRAIVISTQLFHKGASFAIEAFERLRARGMDVRLTLVGNFETTNYAFRQCLPDKAEWIRRAASHDWISMLGPVPLPQVFNLLQQHDVCLYASVDESLGWLPIEAAMSGKAVIGTRIAAFPEFVLHEKTGLLIDIPVTERDRWAGLFMQDADHKGAFVDLRERMVQGIENGVARMVHDRSLARTWGKEGRRLVQQMYGMKPAGATLESLYSRALDRR